MDSKRKWGDGAERGYYDASKSGDLGTKRRDAAESPRPSEHRHPPSCASVHARAVAPPHLGRCESKPDVNCRRSNEKTTCATHRTCGSTPSRSTRTSPCQSCRDWRSRAREGRPGSGPSKASRSRGGLRGGKRRISGERSDQSAGTTAHPSRSSMRATTVLAGCRDRSSRLR